jgi:hypothetical protein
MCDDVAEVEWVRDDRGLGIGERGRRCHTVDDGRSGTRVQRRHRHEMPGSAPRSGWTVRAHGPEGRPSGHRTSEQPRVARRGRRRGWSVSAAAVVLDLGRVRAYRWLLRAGLGDLADRRPGGSPVHGLLPAEEAEILAVFEQWAEIDRSHRKLAHRARICTGSGPPRPRCGGCCRCTTSISDRCRVLVAQPGGGAHLELQRSFRSISGYSEILLFTLIAHDLEGTGNDAASRRHFPVAQPPSCGPGEAVQDGRAGPRSGQIPPRLAAPPWMGALVPGLRRRRPASTLAKS